MREKFFDSIPDLRGDRVLIRRLNINDADQLGSLTQNEEVYRYLPTFLFEKKYDDPEYVIDHLYNECTKESLILGVFIENDFCGLIEIYGYRAPILKVSLGYRYLPEFWGQGIATETLKLLADYLLSETKISLITASIMPENSASSRVVEKTGFRRVAKGIPENWGYPLPTITDKWIKTKKN